MKMSPRSVTGSTGKGREFSRGPAGRFTPICLRQSQGLSEIRFLPTIVAKSRKVLGSGFFYRVSRARCERPRRAPARRRGRSVRAAPSTGGTGDVLGSGGASRPPLCRFPPPQPRSPAEGPGAGRRCDDGMLEPSLHLGHCRFSALPSWVSPPPRKGVSRSPASPCPRVPVPAPAGPCALPVGCAQRCGTYDTAPMSPSTGRGRFSFWGTRQKFRQLPAPARDLMSKE